MSELELFMSLTDLLDLGRFVSVGKRNMDGDGQAVVSCLEMIELVGSCDDLGSSLDDLIVVVLMSALSIDVTSTLADEVSVLLGNLAVIGSAHHFLWSKRYIMNDMSS